MGAASDSGGVRERQKLSISTAYSPDFTSKFLTDRSHAASGRFAHCHLISLHFVRIPFLGTSSCRAATPWLWRPSCSSSPLASTPRSPRECRRRRWRGRPGVGDTRECEIRKEKKTKGKASPLRVAIIRNS